jgi:hypothetical protein
MYAEGIQFYLSLQYVKKKEVHIFPSSYNLFFVDYSMIPHRSKEHIDRIDNSNGFKVSAFAPGLYRRHDIVSLDSFRTIIFHSNSLKTEKGKASSFLFLRILLDTKKTFK